MKYVYSLLAELNNANIKGGLTHMETEYVYSHCLHIRYHSHYSA